MNEHQQKNWPPSHKFTNVYLGDVAGEILNRYKQSDNTTGQRMFDLFLGLVYAGGLSPSDGLLKGVSDVKTNLVLQTDAHLKLFNEIKQKWGLRPWETVRYIIVEGDRILRENPLQEEGEGDGSQLSS